jgi:hypothetical protein
MDSPIAGHYYERKRQKKVETADKNRKLKNLKKSENFQRSEGTNHPTLASARKQTTKAQAHRAHISSNLLRHKEAGN